MGGQGLSLVVAIGLPVAGGVLGSIYTVPAVKKWYPTLKKPSWTPPNWLFGPVWTALYAVQLALNFSWSPLFFGAKKFGLALANITALGVAVGITSHAFYAVDPLASKLFWPYLFWVSYATALNAYIYLNNPPQTGDKDE